MMSPQQRAAHVRWSREDPTAPDAAPARMRAAFDRKFYERADPDGTLPPAARERRAAKLRQLYFADLSAKGTKARRRKAAERRAANAAEAGAA